VDNNSNIIDPSEYVIASSNTGELYARAGSLINLDTRDLNFDLNHPVDISV
jgi:hypothetical protein